MTKVFKEKNECECVCVCLCAYVLFLCVCVRERLCECVGEERKFWLKEKKRVKRKIM